MTSHVTGADVNAMADASPLAFIFSGNEMIVQCTANNDDMAAALRFLGVALKNFKNFNDGKHAIIVRSKLEPTKYWITSALYAENLDKDAYYVVKSTEADTAPTFQPAVTLETSNHPKVTKFRIRRPRNQFIIYRQWMSSRIHASNPGLTATCISRIVAKTWRAEKPEIKVYFKALADEENRIHKEKYPGYRYVAVRRDPQLLLSKRNLPHDPMTVDERLIAAGF
ncbi:mat A-3 [Corynascus novoguineensis]|uniref:Mat A-3 n=1 Tax=Corynascus novoguineensis TaxID=1126955 RepID=A0AAN7HGD2_9PEZI|nr:mat A-3 [Corynascus novoguineensis]